MVSACLCRKHEDMVARIFVHGPGGSGKTFMLKEVILPVYEEYLPGASRGIAAQNSAARLIGGSTFHHMAGLTRGQELLFQKPSKSKKEAIHKKWARLALAFVDEISLTAPNLLAMLHASACYDVIFVSSGFIFMTVSFEISFILFYFIHFYTHISHQAHTQTQSQKPKVTESNTHTHNLIIKFNNTKSTSSNLSETVSLTLILMSLSLKSLSLMNSDFDEFEVAQAQKP